MVKIKDDVDLKELEELGFEYDCNKQIMYWKTEPRLFVIVKTKEVNVIISEYNKTLLDFWSYLWQSNLLEESNKEN